MRWVASIAMPTAQFVMVLDQSVMISNVEADSRVSPEVAAQVGVAVSSGIDIVPAGEVRTAAEHAGLDQPTTDAIVEAYERAQLVSLKSGLLAAALLALVSLMFTRELPHTRRPDPDEEVRAADAVDA